MKEFFNKNKKLVYGIIVVWSLLILLFLAMSVVSLVKSGKDAGSLVKSEGSGSELPGWNDMKTRNLYKEKWWLEQQLVLAKTDSFSMGINLVDSTVQVQLKGTVLFQAKILKQKPNPFYAQANDKVYRILLANVSRIDSSKANIPKKPIKKVIAPPTGSDAPEAKTDTVKEARIYWQFITNRGIEVVINGVQQNQDSTYSKIPVNADLWNFRTGDGFPQPFKTRDTAPLFLWLNDQDAKSIYRALPERAQLVFRD